MFKDFQQQQQKQQQQKSFNSASYSSKNINQHITKTPVEGEEIRIIATTL